MALKDIREVTVTVQLDRPRQVKFDLNAFAELEDKYGNMEAAFHEMQNGSMKAARTLLWAGLLGEEPTLTEREVGALVTLSNISEVMDTITKALTQAVPESSEAETENSEANPT